MADNNRTYTTWMQTKVGDKTVVYLEGYVREDREGNTVTIKEVNGKDGPVNVATVLVSVTIGDRRAENLLGYVNKEYGSYFVRISMFGSVCEDVYKRQVWERLQVDDSGKIILVSEDEKGKS